MVEKLPADFVRNVYGVLINGNSDVNFCCACERNKNHEAATNNPVDFALKLVKINVICRVPFLKKKIFSVPIGEKCLSDEFIRPTICDIASGMLDNKHIVTDVFESAIVSVKSRDEIFRKIEKQTGVKGFAKKRKAFENSLLPIKEIYSKINHTLKCNISYNTELELVEKNYIKNRYITRLIDIAHCNNVKVTAFVLSSYPKDFIVKLLDKFKITADSVVVSNNKKDFDKILCDNFTGVLSSNFNGCVKPFMKKGCVPLYYRTPKITLAQAKHPAMKRKFCEVYDGICGVRMFGGMKRYSFEYELAYLCVAPAVFGFAQWVVMQAEGCDRILCTADENSVFGSVLKNITGNSKKLLFSVNNEKMLADKKLCVADTLNNPQLQILCEDYKNVSLADYLDIPQTSLELFTELINSKDSATASSDFSTAINDFTADFLKYFKFNDEYIEFSNRDVTALYLKAEHQIRKCVADAEVI